MKEYTSFDTMVTILDIISDSPMDKKSLLKKAGINATRYAKYSTLLLELGLVQRTEIFTLSESRITDSCLEITRKGKNFLNQYLDLIESNMLNSQLAQPEQQ